MNWTNANNVILLHMNIRSLQKNCDSLYEFIDSLNCKLGIIICLAESQIKHLPLINLNLPNYHFIYVSPSSNAGGVAVYVIG